MEQNLASHNSRAGLEVQFVGHPGQPALLLGVEDITGLQLHPIDDQ
jgi:hypothetical protein